ncbi:MAG: hypothetical protein Q9211_003869 [Gyalolechia sp. 1 TL-2023]
MEHLTLDSQCPDSYSECGSSNSSSSYGVLTPTSSTAFSAATSRRQSFASEVQSCNESAFGRVPIFSSEGATTPLDTPPFHLTFHSDTFSSITQGYQSEPSPTGMQHRRRLGTSSAFEGPRLHDPFTSQFAYFNTLLPSGLDGDTQGVSQQIDCANIGPEPMYKPLMDWSGAYSSAFVQGYGQADPGRMAETFSFDASSRFDVDYIHPGLLTAPNYLDFGMVNGTIVETDAPQTVAPQETFVCPNPSFIPTTPVSQSLKAPFQTPPLVKSEPRDSDPVAEALFSPCSSLSDDESPAKGVPGGRERQEPIIVRAHSSSKRLSRSGSSRVRKKTSTQSQHAKYPFEHDIVNSNNKAHLCIQCGYRFERPEHFKRHRTSEHHINQCKALGIATEHREPIKAWRCQVEGCDTAVTRKDNLKPHYQKTHFFRNPAKKRNVFVSVEEAERLGLQDWDPRRAPSGAGQKNSCKTVKAEVSDDEVEF